MNAILSKGESREYCSTLALSALVVIQNRWAFSSFPLHPDANQLELPQNVTGPLARLRPLILSLAGVCLPGFSLPVVIQYRGVEVKIDYWRAAVENQVDGKGKNAHGLFQTYAYAQALCLPTHREGTNTRSSILSSVVVTRRYYLIETMQD